MTYNPAIPAAADDPSVSQGQMLTNFTLINTYINVDHVALNALADQGKHNQSTYLTSAVAPASGAGEGSIFVQNTGGARQHCYFRRESNGIQIPISTFTGGFCRVNAGALLGDNFNIAGVASGGVGIYNITFTNNLTSVNYATFVQIHGDVGQAWTENFAVGSVQVRTATNAGVLVARNFSLLIVGEIT
jgi:hypothetical protein